MQIKLFTVPVGDSGGALQGMNAFLRGISKTLGFSPGRQRAPHAIRGFSPKDFDCVLECVWSFGPGRRGVWPACVPPAEAGG